MQDIIMENLQKNIILLRINRSEHKNALNISCRKELCSYFSEFEKNDDVKCVILAGSEQHFAVGADISELVDLAPNDIMELQKLWDPIVYFSKPMISAVDGYAIGGGCELALMSDIIIAGKNAKFGLPEAKVGIMPGAGGTQRLPRIIGKYRAMLMLLTGEIISADKADQIGLVSKVIIENDVISEATKIAQKITSLSPKLIRQIKEVVNIGQDCSFMSSLYLERKVSQSLYSTFDQKEGMKAFLEKRKPKFEGK